MAASIIPPQESGVETNTESSVEFKDEEQARAFYTTARERLLQVNSWHRWAGAASAEFRLTDEKGVEVDRMPQTGDHFKIDIPGPGPATGEGFDWVRIEAVEENESNDASMTAIKVRPATSPLNDRSDIAHFFSDAATSSFVVKRQGKKLVAAVYGRNEKPNIHSEKIVDKARNAAIATGAISGFSKLQWKNLVAGFLKQKDQED